MNYSEAESLIEKREKSGINKRDTEKLIDWLISDYEESRVFGDVWAYEYCFCKYETGFQVVSLHRTKDLAVEAMQQDIQKRKSDLSHDGYRVQAWQINRDQATPHTEEPQT